LRWTVGRPRELTGKTLLLDRWPGAGRRTVGTIMNNLLRTPSPRSPRTPDMGIEWEIQPSLQHLVRRTDDAPHDAPTWAETMPVSLEAMNTPATFREPLEGLSVRDIDEPEIFKVFFGDAAAPAARA
jgi:hypothetical protein